VVSVIGPAQLTVVPLLLTQLTRPNFAAVGAVVVVVVVELVVVDVEVDVEVEVEVEVDVLVVVVPPDNDRRSAETVYSYGSVSSWAMAEKTVSVTSRPVLIATVGCEGVAVGS
jgi:hypothetical protein